MPQVWRRTRDRGNDELWHALPMTVLARMAKTRSWSSAAAVLPPAARCPAGCLARCWRAWWWLPWSRWPSAASATRPGPPRRPRPRRLRCASPSLVTGCSASPPAGSCSPAGQTNCCGSSSPRARSPRLTFPRWRPQVLTSRSSSAPTKRSSGRPTSYPGTSCRTAVRLGR